jgi:murein DD-endopeptidase MepM/ murein hydrolase activator NlpD
MRYVAAAMSLLVLLTVVIAAATVAVGLPGGATAAAPGDPFAGACRPVVTQPYGPTTVIGEPVIDGRPFHTGIDLACPAGTPVHSVTGGLARVTHGWSGGFGNNVVVEADLRLPGADSPQRCFIRYAHLLEDIVVGDGAVVTMGELIGFEGSTGFSTGPHLHFEVDRGQPSVLDSVDPAPLLQVVR